MERILIIGFGDIGGRVVDHLSKHYVLYALVRSEASGVRARQLGVHPIHGDLDRPKSLGRLSGLADAVLHFAPPARAGIRDQRTRNLVARLSTAKILPQRLVYISTSGVYGDCAGEQVSEVRRLSPATARAIRRADAETVLRGWGRRTGVCVNILRVPGIYATERLPVERLEKGIPALRPEDDVYTNHIHADDLAQAVLAALRRGRSGRVYNIADDMPLKMAEYFDRVADHLGLARPPRISRADAHKEISPGMLSYMNESRRIDNTRIKRELGVRLRYPGIAEGLRRD